MEGATFRYGVVFKIKENMNAGFYTETILKSVMLHFAEDGSFLQNNDQKHTSKQAKFQAY